MVVVGKGLRRLRQDLVRTISALIIGQRSCRRSADHLVGSRARRPQQPIGSGYHRLVWVRMA
jgi:hypothetical protein